MNIFKILNVERENNTKMKEKFTCDILILKQISFFIWNSQFNRTFCILFAKSVKHNKGEKYFSNINSHIHVQKGTEKEKKKHMIKQTEKQ